MMWTRLCVVLRCVPIRVGAKKPTIPTRMNTTPKIVAIVFAMTLVSPPWEERLDKRRGGDAKDSGLAAPPSLTDIRVGALYNETGACRRLIFARTRSPRAKRGPR